MARSNDNFYILFTIRWDATEMLDEIKKVAGGVKSLSLEGLSYAMGG